MTKLNDLEQEVLEAIPALREVYDAPTLKSYFTNGLNRLAQCRPTKEFEILLRVITQEVKRVYGAETAAGVYAQLRRIPVAETGTHLSFIRDFEDAKGCEDRPLLAQNILISAALSASVGAKYHIGLYSSCCKLTNPCSGGYYQLGTSVYPVTTSRKLKSSELYLTEGISEQFFNETILFGEKLKMLYGLAPYRCGFCEAMLVPLQKAQYDNFQKAIDRLSTKLHEQIKKMFIEFEDKAREVYGFGFTDVDKQYDELKTVFGRSDLSLAEQVTLIQTADIQKALPKDGIRHLTIDAARVITRFFEKCMRDKDTVWYQIFADDEKRQAFCAAFHGVRSAWKEGESPFDRSETKDGFGRVSARSMDTVSHTPEQIAADLAEQKIFPGTALVVLGFYSASFLAHGGFFQSNYGKEAQGRFVNYLKQNGFERHAAAVEPLPAELILLSLAGAVKKEEDGTTRPLKLTEIMRLPETSKDWIFKSLPYLSGRETFENAATVLRRYLDKTAPGYVTANAQKARALSTPTPFMPICVTKQKPLPATDNGCQNEGYVYA